MNKKSNDWIKILGWLLFVLAIGFFCLQMGYLYAHKRFQVEYIDDRIFYMINIMSVACLALAVIMLLALTKKWKTAWISIATIFVMINGFLLIVNNLSLIHISEPTRRRD